MEGRTKMTTQTATLGGSRSAVKDKNFADGQSLNRHAQPPEWFRYAKFNSTVSLAVILATVGFCASANAVRGDTAASTYLGNTGRTAYVDAEVPAAPVLQWVYHEKHPPAACLAGAEPRGAVHRLRLRHAGGHRPRAWSSSARRPTTRSMPSIWRPARRSGRSTRKARCDSRRWSVTAGCMRRRTTGICIACRLRRAS